MLEQFLQTAIRHTRYTCVLGAPNKIEDAVATDFLLIFNKNRNKTYSKYEKSNLGNWSISYKEDAKDTDIHDLIEFIDPNDIALQYQFILKEKILAADLRQGACGKQSCNTYCFLWENSEKYNQKCSEEEKLVRIEVFTTVFFDHQFVVVNRAYDSEVNQPRTWGKAWIVDSWWDEGKVISASEFSNLGYINLWNYCQEEEKKYNDFFKLENSSVRNYLYPFGFRDHYSLTINNTPYPKNLRHTFDSLALDLSMININLYDVQETHYNAFLPTLSSVKFLSMLYKKDETTPNPKSIFTFLRSSPPIKKDATSIIGEKRKTIEKKESDKLTTEKKKRKMR